MATQKGYFAPFGWQLYSKDAKINILSHQNMISKFFIYYDNKNCQYIMTNKKNRNEKYQFIRSSNGLYKYNGQLQIHLTNKKNKNYCTTNNVKSLYDQSNKKIQDDFIIPRVEE